METQRLADEETDLKRASLCLPSTPSPLSVAEVVPEPVLQPQTQKPVAAEKVTPSVQVAAEESVPKLQTAPNPVVASDLVVQSQSRQPSVPVPTFSFSTKTCVSINK